MSVVIKREHPSGEVGLSVEAFRDDASVVLGIGPLKDMKFFKMSVGESADVANTLLNAAVKLARA